MKRQMEETKSQGTDRRTFLKASALTVGAAAALGAPLLTSGQTKYSGEKIYLFCNILPPKYNEAFVRKGVRGYNFESNSRSPQLVNLDLRLRTLDKFEGLKQVLTLGAPGVESAFPQDAVDMARMANDGMTEIVNKYPDRIVAAIASLPMNNVDAALREAERAFKDLKCKGIQVFSSINGKPLDSPEFFPIYEMMAQYDLPILIHPGKEREVPDYPDEKASKYTLFVAFGWPYETTLALGRLVYSGVMEKYPNLKIVAHHCGAMIPFFSERIRTVAQAGVGEIMKLTKPPEHYFKRIYGDTVLGRNSSAMMCGYHFFGADHMIFSTDYPYPGADVGVQAVINGIEGMTISDEEKAKIFSKNVRQLLKLG
ncbi:MAG: amidohydrolase 2 [Deltaproteobacteria bacterium]|nr:amidohydrolase 2 [Deltaproteobacteria bacterium]